MVEAKIKFFDIKKCGYFLRGQNETEFSGISDTLMQLNNWATGGREFVNTTCYEADPDNDIRNTYFCGWHRNEINEDSVLILWNEVANDNGVIYGMQPMQLPGATEMLTTGFGNTPAIPGFPSYFWFVPNESVFATIRFNHSVQGKKNLDYYLNGFLENKAPYRILDDDDETVVGFSPTGLPTEKSSRLYSKFYAIGRKQEELEAELLNNRHKIRRIIKKESLNYTVEDDRRTIERLFSNLLGNTPNFNQVRSITHELQFEPTEPELVEIINNFSNIDAGNSIRNAGFIYNDGKRIMLKGTMVAFSTELNVQEEENQIISPQQLLNALTEQRQHLLEYLGQPAFEEGAVA